MTECGWQHHSVSRRENGDGTVTLALHGSRYTTTEERTHGDTAICRWCTQPVRRTGSGWETETPGDCPDAGPLLPSHSPEPLPAVVLADDPCVTATVPARYVNWDGEQRKVIESGDAAEMVTAHCGEPYTVIWQGRGWTVEISSGYLLWQMTG